MQGTVIDDRYTLVQLLGSGGMAQVHLAHDEVLDRDVALKILRRQYADDEEFVGRFRQEARSAASLSHPNIVSIYDQGRSEDGSYYIAMEYVSRGTLKERIGREGALAPGAAVGVALQISEALSAAHEKGIVHRDVKPHNVLVTRTGDIKVTDFGIARAAAATRITRTGAVLGTAGYVSPEQAMGKAVGPQGDLYSLGVVLYEMLAGNLPFEADDPLALAMKHVSEPPPSPREANPEVSEALDALTTKLLAKDPEDRYKSADALANDLERVRSGLPLAARSRGAEEEATTPLSSPPGQEGRTQRMAVRPPVARPSGLPGGGRKRRAGRLLPALAALLFGLAVLGGLVWALGGLDVLGPGAFGDRSGPGQAEVSGVEVPNVVGLWRDVALQRLAASGFQPVVEPRESSWEEAGIVLDQSVAGGQRAEEGSTIVIGVGNVPSVVPAPAPDLSVPGDVGGGVTGDASSATPASPQAVPGVPTQPSDEDGGDEVEKAEKED